MRINLAAREPFDHNLDHLQRPAEKECGILGTRFRNEDRLCHQIPECEQRADQQRLIEREASARNARVSASLAHSLLALRL